MGSESWRTERRNVYAPEFKLRLVKMATAPGACVADIARENGLNDNVLFRWIRLWQREGRVSRKQPASLPAKTSAPVVLPVELIVEPAAGEAGDDPVAQAQNTLPASAAASSCRLQLRHGRMTLENPSAQMLAVLVRELSGRGAQ